MKLSDLESLFKSSNNEKDRQLLLYQDEIQQLQDRTRESIGSGEAMPRLPALREQLRVFMSQCQDFETQLDKVEVTPAAKEETTIELKPVTKQAVEVCLHRSVTKMCPSFTVGLVFSLTYDMYDFFFPIAVNVSASKQDLSLSFKIKMFHELIFHS